jgi:protein phosphatase slingshot
MRVSQRFTLEFKFVAVDFDRIHIQYYLLQLRNRLEQDLDMNLTDYKHFIDEEMIIIMRQMDAPSEIFDYLYLGSEWNASNLEELRKNGLVCSDLLIIV